MTASEAANTGDIHLHENVETMETESTSGHAANCSRDSAAERKPRYKNIMHLWEFLLELLADDSCNSLIAWSRKTHGEFRLKNPQEVAIRWGSVKHKQDMNYEKLSRALRHYYKQGIIKKVDGQRLVYKFHELPYQYTPGKTDYLDNSRMLSTNSDRQGEYSFEDFLSSSNENLDNSERSLTDKERIKKIFQERVNAKQNMNQPINTEQEDEVVPSTTASPQSSTASPLPQVYPKVVIPIPVRPSTCNRGCELQVVNPPICTCQIVFPVPVDRQQDHDSTYVLKCGAQYVPVSVIKRFQSASTDAGEPIKLTRKSV